MSIPGLRKPKYKQYKSFSLFDINGGHVGFWVLGCSWQIWLEINPQGQVLVAFSAKLIYTAQDCNEFHLEAFYRNYSVSLSSQVSSKFVVQSFCLRETAPETTGSLS